MPASGGTAPPVPQPAPVGSHGFVDARGRAMHLISISVTCPRTKFAIPLDVPGDFAALARIWRMRRSVKCPHCGETHSVRVCDAYINTMTSDGYLRWLEAGTDERKTGEEV
jgi:hypothetical protein